MKPDWFVVNDMLVVDMNSIAAVYATRGSLSGNYSIVLKNDSEPIEIGSDNGVNLVNEIARRVRLETPLR